MEQIFQELFAFATASWERFSHVDRGLLLINILVLIFAKPLFARLGDGSAAKSSALNLLRAGTLLIILFLVFYNMVLPHEEHTFVTRLLGVLLLLYVGYLALYLINSLIRRRFGKPRELGGESFIAETYNSRLLTLLAGILICSLTLVAVIEVLGFENLLHASGVFGVIGVMLALTQSSWAPDLISGLIILNNRLLEEGDVIEVNGDDSFIGMVFRTKMFHTELLDLSRNHRVMMQNGKLRGSTIRNLSKFASAKGLRERLDLNIGYEVPDKSIRRMIDEALATLQKTNHVPVEFAHGYDLHTVSAANYAVTWSLFYYTKDLRNLVTTRYNVVAAIVAAATKHGIQLATPVLVTAPTANVPAILSEPPTAAAEAESS